MTEAVIRMERKEGGWRVEIRETTPHSPGSRAFAAVEAYDIDTALRMATPYLAVLSQPDPFAELAVRPGRTWPWRPDSDALEGTRSSEGGA